MHPVPLADGARSVPRRRGAGQGDAPRRRAAAGRRPAAAGPAGRAGGGAAADDGQVPGRPFSDAGRGRPSPGAVRRPAASSASASRRPGAAGAARPGRRRRRHCLPVASAAGRPDEALGDEAVPRPAGRSGRSVAGRRPGARQDAAASADAGRRRRPEARPRRAGRRPRRRAPPLLRPARLPRLRPRRQDVGRAQRQRHPPFRRWNGPIPALPPRPHRPRLSHRLQPGRQDAGLRRLRRQSQSLGAAGRAGEARPGGAWGVGRRFGLRPQSRRSHARFLRRRPRRAVGPRRRQAVQVPGGRLDPALFLRGRRSPSPRRGRIEDRGRIYMGRRDRPADAWSCPVSGGGRRRRRHGGLQSGRRPSGGRQ